MELTAITKATRSIPIEPPSYFEAIVEMNRHFWSVANILILAEALRDNKTCRSLLAFR
jgi:hypothetical protein